MFTVNDNQSILKSLSEKIIENFNFSKVANYMISNEISWETGIPNEEELMECVKELFNWVISSKDDKLKVSSGGFTLEKDLSKSPEKWLNLKYKMERIRKEEICTVEKYSDPTLKGFAPVKKSGWLN